MPKRGVSIEFDQRVEDMIASMLQGRTALVAIESLFLANLRVGNLTEEEYAMLSDDMGAARHAIEIGLRLGRWVRSPPPDLEAKLHPAAFDEK